MEKNIFKPKSIAVIGASENKKKLGYQVLKNILAGGYQGAVYPININPKTKKILGKKSYTSVLEIDKKIDAAIFLIPARFVSEVLKECGKKKIKLAVIISSGFKETGEAGEVLEKDVLKIAKKYGVRILGPNCLGYIDASIKLNASFAPGMPKEGGVSVISQSGAICTAILDWAEKSNAGFSNFFSIGNKSDISELDLIPYLAKDDKTKVIVAYLEGISEKNHGVDFRKVTARATMQKPLILMKPGTSKKSQNAISSHTGSLAGSEEAINALFKQSGITRAYSLEDLFDYTEGFSSLKMPKGNRVAIITNAGGPGVMTTDAIEKTRLEFATLSKDSAGILKKKLPLSASISNPVDIIGDADAKRYKEALDIIEKDENVDSILILLTPQTSTQVRETAKIVLKKIRSSQKTIIPVFMGGRRANKGVDIFEKEKCAVFEYPERAVRVLEKISYCNSCELGIKKIYPPKVLKISKQSKAKVDHMTKMAQKLPHLLPSKNSDNILKIYGIDTTRSSFANNTEEALAASKRIGYPVVLKVDSPDISHKSDFGGVITGIKNEKEAKLAFAKIISNVKRLSPSSTVNGVMIYEMIHGGTDFYIGAKRDPLYGPVIGFGLGGIYIEILKDVAFRLAPLSEFDIEKMLGELKSSKIISGTRGRPALNKKGIIDALIKVSNLMINHPQIQELDINPLRVFENKAVALDSRIIINNN